VLLLYGIDTMVQTAFPEKCDYPPYNEQAIRATVREIDGVPHATLTVMPYMYPVYRAAVEFYRRLSGPGYDLIVDEVLFGPVRISQYVELLSDETVYFIGIAPAKDVVVRRERERGDRTIGLAAGLHDLVHHPDFRYDLCLDTGTLAPEEAADRVLCIISVNDAPTGFSITARRWREREPAAP